MNKMMTDDTFNVQWDENDMIQVQEDDWVASILGTEEEAIYDVLAELSLDSELESNQKVRKQITFGVTI